MPAKPRRTKILSRNRPKAASATAPTAHTSEATVRTREGAGKSKYSVPAAQAMKSAAIRLPKAIKTKRTAHMDKRGTRPRGEEDRTALGIYREISPAHVLFLYKSAEVMRLYSAQPSAWPHLRLRGTSLAHAA